MRRTGFLDGLLVNFDHQAAQQLVEVVFQTVFFGVSYLDGELHRFLSFVSVLILMHCACRSGLVPAQPDSRRMQYLHQLLLEAAALSIGARDAQAPTTGPEHDVRSMSHIPKAARVPNRGFLRPSQVSKREPLKARRRALSPLAAP